MPLRDTFLCLPILEIELRISGVGCNCSAHRAATTAQSKMNDDFLQMSKLLLLSLREIAIVKPMLGKGLMINKF